MNQCKICGQIYILIVIPVMMGSGKKEKKTWITRMIRNSISCNQFHTVTQGRLDGVTKSIQPD